MSVSPAVMMRRVLELAAAGPSDDLPIAAIISDQHGTEMVASRNAIAETGRSTAHAELLAIEQFELTTLKRYGRDLSMIVTLEPCPMCAWAIKSSGIGKLIFGAYNPHYGSAGSVYDLLRDRRQGLPVEVIGGVLEEECKRLLDGAFLDIRNNGSR